MKQLRRTNFNLKPETYEALTILSTIEERTMTAILEDVLQDYFNQHSEQIEHMRKAKQEVQKMQTGKKGTKQNGND